MKPGSNRAFFYSMDSVFRVVDDGVPVSFFKRQVHR
jgi:hypothetical protein